MSEKFIHKSLDPTHKSSILSMRHLEDQNTLLSEGRDNSLMPNQEKRSKEIARLIHQEAVIKNCNSVVFYASNKKRTRQTTDLIKFELKRSKVIESTHSIFDSRINELNNGIMNFSTTYKDGDWFEPLPLAWDSFFKEISEGDLLYRFGDPKKQSDGKLKYPEIAGHFAETGENYSEFCSRIFEFLSQLDISQDLKAGKLPVIITHNAIVSVALEISFVYYDLFKKGELLDANEQPSLNKLIWDMFRKYNNSSVKFDMGFGEVRSLNLDFLNDPEFREYLKRESRLLKIVNSYSNKN
jgi:broad specificity phosphatase PhoE